MRLYGRNEGVTVLDVVFKVRYSYNTATNKETKMSLAKFIEQENRMRKFFKQPEYDVNNITPEDAQELFGKIDSNLSPEILACDGERPRSKQIRLAKIYRAAWAELRAKGFTPQGYCYNV